MEVTGEKLKQFVARIERLEQERQDRADDLKEVYAEAKADGFETKIIKKLIKLRKQEATKRREEQELLAVYASAIQMELF